jgi:hypothetical protein
MNRTKTNQKTTSRCAQVVTPILAEGEQIEMVEAAQVGKVSAKRRIATTAAVTIATAGTVMIALKPAAFYLVLTNQRLIFVQNFRGRVGKIAAAVPRAAVTAEPLRGHMLTLSMNVTIDGTAQYFSWGRAQPGMARRVAEALTAAGEVPAA